MILARDQCPFCQSTMTYNATSDLYRCNSCQVYQRYTLNNTKTWVYCLLGSKKEEYNVEMNTAVPETVIRHYAKHENGYAWEETIMTFPRIISFTPQNIKDKLSLLLVFS